MVKLRTTRAYEADRDLLASVENRYAPAGANTLISKYEYTNNDLNLRTEVAYSGTAFGSPSPPPTQPFGYNDRNELTSSTLHGSPDKDWTYAYDPIGNRVAASQPVGIEEAYLSNELNQYSRARVEDSVVAGAFFGYDADGNLTDVGIAGDMNCDGVVDNGDYDPFVLALVDPEEYESTYLGCDILRADINQDSYVDNGDLDGFVDLLLGAPSGTAMVYTWDAENRLIGVAPHANAVLTAGAKRAAYEYDWMGRRIRRTVDEWDSGWSTIADIKYV